MKVIVSEGSGGAQSLQALEEAAAPGGLGWAEGGGGGRYLGDPDERGDSKRKQKGAGTESQGPDLAEVLRTPHPCGQPDT